MSEKELSEGQISRIEELKDKWLKQFEEIPPDPTEGRHFDGPRTTAINKLSQKYMKLLQEIYEE
ncbi:MAG: hypothetical protein NC412_13935 [Roseburia sp.]|nr:hypothetical protein [Roseburia sp.]MCM1280198.1 hypothetical protein [Robinsoniella sp.]